MECRTEYVGSTLPSTLGPGHALSLTTCLSAPQFRNFKIIYRRYAGLYFCICVDVNDNNLAYLEAIHNFVEVHRRAGAVPRPLCWDARALLALPSEAGGGGPLSFSAHLDVSSGLCLSPFLSFSLPFFFFFCRLILMPSVPVSVCVSLSPCPSLTTSVFLSQVLNEYFHNVCELDLVFNFYKVGSW